MTPVGMTEMTEMTGHPTRSPRSSEMTGMTEMTRPLKEGGHPVIPVIGDLGQDRLENSRRRS
jgi:hypothetical protein